MEVDEAKEENLRGRAWGWPFQQAAKVDSEGEEGEVGEENLEEKIDTRELRESVFCSYDELVRFLDALFHFCWQV